MLDLPPRVTLGGARLGKIVSDSPQYLFKNRYRLFQRSRRSYRARPTLV